MCDYIPQFYGLVDVFFTDSVQLLLLSFIRLLFVYVKGIILVSLLVNGFNALFDIKLYLNIVLDLKVLYDKHIPLLGYNHYNSCVREIGKINEIVLLFIFLWDDLSIVLFERLLVLV